MKSIKIAGFITLAFVVFLYGCKKIELDINLHFDDPPCILTGTLMSSYGSAVPYQAVYIQERMQSTDGDGIFRFTDLEPKYSRVIVDAIGFEDSNESIYIEKRDQVFNIRLVQEPFYPLNQV